jgi:uncharacterized protein (DUF1697 family)
MKKNQNIFVALLRGVNVGGNNMINMKSLKASFEKMGFSDVSTYINSGNIIFKAKEADARKLERKIEQMLVKEYQLESKVVLRSFPEMAKLVKGLPKNWNGDSSWRFYVMFLRHTIDSEEIVSGLPVNVEMEEVVYRPGALLWSALVSDLTRSKMAKAATGKMYKDTTVRNLNTTNKLYELMKKLDESGT